ncbi:MAG TPA: LysR family transcriptional regulator [Candidatus Copromorpha excrementavium]|uniref:LysR family transcriptional regulator n=1 Tax=Candidatus Allocopromorpha excrementavium TaxID=2840741 RepID=A0A9D1HC92_9FIRM|nr:LysR family transcriptional regulator [Candidatus Copromorpha excrementavium]
MELRVLRYFLAAVRNGSITAAANELHITQPTLSKQLMDLESKLGKTLFIRGGRKITLTEEGKFLYDRANEIVSLADSTEAELKSDDDIINGEIRIGSGETHNISYIADAIKQITEIHPNIKIHLYSGNEEDISERLDSGLFDFALFIGISDMRKYDYIKLPVCDKWGLLMRKDYPLSVLDAITPEDIQNIPLIFPRQVINHNDLSDWTGPQEKLNIKCTYNLLFNASVMTERGIGCTVCLGNIADTSPESNLCFRPLRPEVTAELYLAWKKHRVLSKASKKFLETLKTISL